MTRGDLITAALPGGYGKPRPCLVVQSDRLAKLDSVLLCPLTSHVETGGPARVRIDPNEANGLTVPSVIMVDKITALSKARCRQKIGTVDGSAMEQVNGVLLFVMGLLD